MLTREGYAPLSQPVQIGGAAGVELEVRMPRQVSFTEGLTVVGRISDFSTTIASAVEEQTATTNEMSRNVTETAEAAGQIAENITQVSAGASSTSEAAGEASRTTTEVSTVVGDLKSTVGRFQY